MNNKNMFCTISELKSSITRELVKAGRNPTTEGINYVAENMIKSGAVVIIEPEKVKRRKLNI